MLFSELETKFRGVKKKRIHNNNKGEGVVTVSEETDFENALKLVNNGIIKDVETINEDASGNITITRSKKRVKMTVDELDAEWSKRFDKQPGIVIV